MPNFPVPEILDGDRLDRTIRALQRDLSWSTVRRLIGAGRVRVAGNVVADASFKVRAGDVLMVDASGDTPRTGAAAAPEVPVLHEDAHVIAFHKPSGLATSPTGHKMEPNLLDLVRRSHGRIYMVHRLDAGTSGVVLFARTRSAQLEVVRLFRVRRVAKTYLAVVSRPPVPPSGTVRSRLGRPDAGRRQSTEEGGREAVTEYALRGPAGRGFLVELRPVTGRTHQLRIHMKELGCPILGDVVYGTPETRSAAPRLMLHAVRLELPVPWSPEPLRIEAPAPPAFAPAAAPAPRTSATPGRGVPPRPRSPGPRRRWPRAPGGRRPRGGAPRA